MRFLLLFSILLTLVACAPQPTRQPQHAPTVKTPPPTRTPDAGLQQQAEIADRQGELATLTRLLTRLWQISDADRRLYIEYLLYSRWRHATVAQRALAWHTQDEAIAPWALLAELQSTHDPAALEKVLALYPDALPGQHLAPYLNRPPPLPRRIAVFLPLSGRFQAVSEQLRHGLLTALFSQTQPVVLRFYDSNADEETLNDRYRQALEAGADAVLGPLRPDTIAALSDIDRLPTLFLNNPANGFGYGFPYASASEAAQLHARLLKDGQHRIGLLYRETPRAAQLAASLTARMSKPSDDPSQPDRIVSHTISTQHRLIRQRFDQLMRIDASKERAHYLRQTLGHRLAFQPRPREDLQALVLLMGRDEAAIINPLLSFYGLRLPVYGSSLLMSTQHSARDNPDLAGIRFPAFPFLMSGKRMTPLQAWGYDALNLMLTPQPATGCVNGLTGRLHRNGDNLWDRRLIWLKYDASGKLIRVD